MFYNNFFFKPDCTDLCQSWFLIKLLEKGGGEFKRFLYKRKEKKRVIKKESVKRLNRATLEQQ